jgi:CDP-glucose 4,6-dehydratase
MTKTAPKSSAAFGKIYAGKKVLLTGHTGFKGSWLSEWLLLLGAEVTGYSIDCEEPSLFNQLKLTHRLRDTRGDVRDLPLVTKLLTTFAPDFVFHLAAQPLVRHSYVDPVGTFTTNVTGSINVMEAVRLASHRCAVVMVTTDKCYENREISYAYRETDPLGGHDPYSASKAAAEIAIDSYRKSFFSAESDTRVALASARAGNVIGGGDWATDRLVPDAIRSLQRKEEIPVRNKGATRPWQHVLDPLSGYLTLGAALWQVIAGERTESVDEIRSAFNFGPGPDSNRTVSAVADEVLKNWPGSWVDRSDSQAPHEAGLLNLNIEKAARVLGWRPVWNFSEAVGRTVAWYRSAHENGDPWELTSAQISDYQNDAATRGLTWAAP